MKKSLFFSAAATLLLASCASDELVDISVPSTGTTHSDIRFTTNQKNITRVTPLQKAGHFNFGVFGYKSTDKVNNIMADYLVGYYDTEKGYGTQAGSTFGDPTATLDGKSYWMYEGMGHAEYNGTYAGETVNPGTKFASNVANQYLRYWDNASDYTCFYAYAPYTNNTATGNTITYVDGQEVGTSTDKYVMTIPNGTIKHGYDKEDEFEYMYAWTKVEKANYGHDVALEFKRLNAKVNIKFWEDIAGYSVRIIDLTPNYSVSAVPAIKDGTSNNYGYKLGKIYSENGAKIQFAPEAATPAAPTMKQYVGTTVSTPIKFAAPTAAQIGTSRVEATPSATTYYAIPKGSTAGVLANGADKMTDAGTLNTDLAKTGLTFHVSYELISTTGEVITVKDATVFVPTDYTNWVANTHYTYIFKITKNSNGSTDSTDPTDTDAEDPEVPTEPSLYPIVFDNCTVEEWATSESEHVISDGSTLSYHNITLSQYSVTTGAATDIDVTIADGDKSLVHPVDYAAVAVTGPADASSWYSSSTKKISVPVGAASGVYTVTYTCPSSDVYTNHPKTWTAKFVVGRAYTVNTRLNEVGTNGTAATKLTILTSIDGGAEAQPAAATGLSVEYPVNAADGKVKVEVVSDKAYVTVAQNATPGKYKLIYTNNYAVEGGNVVPVKVAEKVFEVKDYTFTLNTYAVLNGTSVTVTASAAPTNGVYTVSSVCTISGNVITVPNNTTEGNYTVTLTVNGRTDEVVTYTKTFNVQNQYSVALSKNTLNTTVGAANAAEYGTEFIEVTSTKNQVADAVSDELAAKYTITGLASDTYKFFVDGSAIKLQVKTSVAAGNYTVVYTGQTTPDTKTAEAIFTIQK